MIYYSFVNVHVAGRKKKFNKIIQAWIFQKFSPVYDGT